MLTEEHDYKGFWQDFTIADAFGVSAIKDTYKRAFDGWKDNVNYYASLVMTLNHKIWQWYGKNEEIARVYNDLWLKADEYGREHFKGEDASYYFEFLD
jgi:hypothetical protein